ncbi:hypothetical protein HIM_07861 [Hirsutella minnesotensis 3608]|uniref:Uncharacterized protein n=1 Tax=Hirsutella minnesotensis 3608 TaxID=1043627 RepID=A0A0F7ZHK2_9HYPO|nr:hypothetical protein HIM_07861 [Hirsutella minnesotensis 3608]
MRFIVAPLVLGAAVSAAADRSANEQVKRQYDYGNSRNPYDRRPTSAYDSGYGKGGYGSSVGGSYYSEPTYSVNSIYTPHYSAPAYSAVQPGYSAYPSYGTPAPGYGSAPAYHRPTHGYPGPGVTSSVTIVYHAPLATHKAHHHHHHHHHHHSSHIKAITLTKDIRVKVTVGVTLPIPPHPTTVCAAAAVKTGIDNCITIPFGCHTAHVHGHHLPPCPPSRVIYGHDHCVTFPVGCALPKPTACVGCEKLIVPPKPIAPGKAIIPVYQVPGEAPKAGKPVILRVLRLLLPPLPPPA